MGSKMKVLLVQDVDKLGKTGEVREVSGGFGRNYLIPQGFAVYATRGQVRQAEQKIAAQRKRDEANRKDAEALAGRINGQTLRFTARAGEDGRLYGSVTSGDIAERLGSMLGVEIDRRKVQLDEPIKRTGSSQVAVRLLTGLEPVVTVEVQGEGQDGNAVPVMPPAAATDDSMELPDLSDEA